MLAPAICPRPAAVLSAPTPASLYTLQQRLLKLYREQLTWWPDRYALLEAVFAGRPGSGPALFEDWKAKHVARASEKLTDKIPELLYDFTAAELLEAEQVLLRQTVIGFCWLVLDAERAVQYRLGKRHSRHRLDDDAQARAAGFGHKPQPRARPVPAPRRAPVPPAAARPSVTAAALRVRRSARFWAQQRERAQLAICF